VLVTEPVPVTVHHKVYAAEYVGDVASSDAGLQVSPVVEGTPSGTILMGASRERVGFDRAFSTDAVARIAASGLGLFPALREVKVQRAYSGFRPYCPDHLPAIGEDGRLPGLWHAAGHEGAGVGLSVGTGKLLAQALRGQKTDLDLAPFRPDRLEGVAAA
jgi:sarcosine oxidase subunit beta